MSRARRFHRRMPRWNWATLAVVAALTLPGAGLAPSGAASAGQDSSDQRQLASPSVQPQEKQAATGAAAPKSLLLKYGDGKADGRKSLGGSGEMIRFELPTGKEKLKAIGIHASRYGYPQPPNENIIISLLSEDMSEVVQTEMAPYKLFKRGNAKWVKINFKKPLDVPKVFWVVLDFKAEQRKGVYVSFDTSTEGKHSKTGLPGREPRDVNFDGDWMIRAYLAN